MSLLFCLLVSAAPSERVALIVTNNKSLDQARPELRYADDDGVHYAALFEERLGADNVYLLSELDVDSARLYPDVHPLAPTRAQLGESGKRLAERLAAARKEGKSTEAWVVFAGHGDTEHGEGFVELQDGRFSASELEALLSELAPASAKDARAHLILDSCNSYFMLNPRKPGGARYGSTATLAPSFFERHPNIGAVISTSAEAETYEWSELQSGIFSYIVRSGLRGAADADGDLAVSYKELDGFATIATSKIVNEKFRPRVYAHAPSNDRAVSFSALPDDPRLSRVKKAKGSARRITVRDSQGVRIADMNASADSALELVLPRRGDAFDVEELGATGSYASYRLSQGTTLVLGEAKASATKPPVAARGEARVFQALFADDFGPASLERSESTRQPEDERLYGVSERDRDRFRLTLGTFAESAATEKKRGAYIGIAVGATMTAAAGGALALGFTAPPDARSASYIAAGALAAFGVPTLIVSSVLAARPPKEQKLYEELLKKSENASDDEKSRLTLEMENALHEWVLVQKKQRKTAGIWSVIGGSSLLVGGAINFGLNYKYNLNTFNVLTSIGLVGMGVVTLTTGILNLTILRTQQERLWELYQAGGTLSLDTAPKAPLISKVNVAPLFAPNTVGLTGGFQF